MPTIPHDFTEPDIAVHIYEQRTLVQAHRPRMRGNGWIDQLIPYLYNLCRVLAAIKANTLEHRGHYAGGRTSTILASAFLLSKIHPTPLR